MPALRRSSEKHVNTNFKQKAKLPFIYRKTYFVIIILSLLTCGRVIYHLAVNLLKPIESVPIIKNVLHLDYLANTGAAFGLFEGNKLFLIGFSAIGVVVCAFFLFSGKTVIYDKNKLPVRSFANFCINTGLCLTIAGGLGNLYERIVHGFVVDYIHFLKPVDFAVFNFSDICVTVSGFMIFFYLILPEQKPDITEKSETVGTDALEEKTAEETDAEAKLD